MKLVALSAGSSAFHPVCVETIMPGAVGSFHSPWPIEETTTTWQVTCHPVPPETVWTSNITHRLSYIPTYFSRFV